MTLVYVLTTDSAFVSALGGTFQETEDNLAAPGALPGMVTHKHGKLMSNLTRLI